MRSFPIVAVLASQAAVSVATPTLEDIYEVAPLLRRQAPGSALYQCHYDCGYTIAGGRVAGYCDAQTWKDLYEACLECANTFDIWSNYGTPVASAAKACGLTASPSPSSAEAPTALPTLPTYAGGAASSSAATTSTTESPGTSTEAPSTSSSGTVTTPPESSTTVVPSSTTSVGTTSTTATTSTSAATVPVNGAPVNSAHGLPFVVAFVFYLLA